MLDIHVVCCAVSQPDWRVSSAERNRYHQAISGGPMDEVVTTFKNALGIPQFAITRQQVQCMKPGQWLNDEVINMYMALLQVRCEQCVAGIVIQWFSGPTSGTAELHAPVGCTGPWPRWQAAHVATNACCHCNMLYYTGSGVHTMHLQYVCHWTVLHLMALCVYSFDAQERDTRLRSNADTDAPTCHFYNTFFLNKLYKDKSTYNYNEVSQA